MMLRRFWFPIAIGLTASGLTARWLLLAERNPYVARMPLVSDALAAGVMIAMMPFGGVHELRIPTPWVILLGSLFNGVVWFVASVGLLSLYRGIQRVRQSSYDEHVT